jgi:multidrug efflux pump
MKFSHFSIDRPVATIVLSVFIAVLGFIALPQLGVREFPAVDPPTITVSTSYAGASADVIESQITEPIEESVNGVDGIRSITSTSREGNSSITVEFGLSADLDAAANDVRDRVSRVLRRLPADADPPTVAKADANSFPILMMSLQSDSRDILDVTDAGTRLRERLQTIPGVAEVRIWGEKRYAMRLRFDPERLAAHDLTLAEVRNALAVENVELPSGRIEGDAMELTVKTSGLLRTAEEFNRLVLRGSEGGLVRLEDVGTATLGAENERTRLTMNGKAMIGLGLISQPGANSVAIGNEFYKRYEQIRKDLPPDLKVGIGFDGTRFVRRSLVEVSETLAIAFVLVLLVLFFFLRDFRSALLPAIAIPVSLIGTLFLLYLAGYTVNVLTLLGLVLAIGLVVDDAIVVLENIYRKIEEGEEPRKAGYEGLEEIFMAVVSTTAVLAVVFLPLFFLEGFVGRLFREFGLAVAGSVLLSAIVSLTLTPMMATRFLRKKHSRLYDRTEPWFQKFYGLYDRSLRAFLGRGFVVPLAVLGVSLAGLVALFLILPDELAPREDRSQVNMFITGPEGFAYGSMAKVMEQVNALAVAKVPEAENVLAVTAPGFSGGGANSGFVRLFLTDPHGRGRSQQDIAKELLPAARSITDVRVVVTQDPTISVGSRSSLPLQFVIQAPSFEKLSRELPRFLEAARKDPAFTIVDENLKFTRPEIEVSVNRDRLRTLGVSFSEVAQALQLAFGETRLGYFQKDSRQYQVIGQVGAEYRRTPRDLGNLQVRNNAGELIPLSNLVDIREEAGPPQLFRYNRWVSATVSADLAPGVSMKDGIDAMNRIAGEVLDASFSTALAGEARDFSESSSSMVFVFALAVILIYLVLAAQFESFRDPVVILLTVPLAVFGALLALAVFGQTLNIFSKIGLVMLIGLVTKNGILIVEFTHQKLEKGLSLTEAVVEASSARLRPILMTSLTAALGMVPIALALGAGAESRRPMGIAVVGGLLFGMVLTLYVIPSMILLFAGKKARAAAERTKTHA